MPHLALTLELTGLLDPAVAEEACFDAGAVAVTLTDAADDAILEPRPGEERHWPRTVLEALFDAEDATPALLADVARRLGVEPGRIAVRAVGDRAWEREWLKDFHAMRFGRRLWIVPHHEPLPTEPDAVVVRLDPGLAFGTGTHPSTALCLEWLDTGLVPGSTVIDYGCGSGVLAIAAAKLGAASVLGYDLDPQAGIATRDNAAANGVLDRVTVADVPETLPGNANLLLANIISGTLCELAPSFAQMLQPGTTLVLAGILEEQADEVIATYSHWFRLEPWQRRGGWVALAGNRCSPPAPTAR
ncbi:MAG: 50S ribosomal protein L11 methyltransferase [Steroidobacteraceae bacterium]